MAKKSTAIAQEGLFTGAPQSLDLDAIVSRSLRIAFRENAKSRQAIAEEMSRLMAKKVTVSMLDHYTAERHPQYRFPAAWLPAFCVACGTCDVLRLLAEAAGFRLVDTEESMLIEYARATLEKKEAAEKIEAIEPMLRRKPNGE